MKEKKKLTVDVKGQIIDGRQIDTGTKCTVHDVVQQSSKSPFMHGLSPDCSTALSRIKSLKIVKNVGDTSGSWFKDPSEGSAKVCSF